MARKTGSHADITGPLVRKAAISLIARHGFAAVTMRQIAAEVGIQAGALYLYTPDKQTLLFDLMHDHLADLLVTVLAEPMLDTPTERLEAFCKFHIRYHLKRPESVFIANMELRNLEPDNFKKVEDQRRQYEAYLASILEAGQLAKDFKVPDCKLATMAIIAMLTGVNTWYQDGGRLTQERVERIYWNMVRRAVGA
ncbi:MAG: TetR/AcrR family transcriptional regulator [Paracoccaceae bacterium]